MAEQAPGQELSPEDEEKALLDQMGSLIQAKRAKTKKTALDAVATFFKGIAGKETAKIDRTAQAAAFNKSILASLDKLTEARTKHGADSTKLKQEEIGLYKTVMVEAVKRLNKKAELETGVTKTRMTQTVANANNFIKSIDALGKKLGKTTVDESKIRTMVGSLRAKISRGEGSAAEDTNAAIQKLKTKQGVDIFLEEWETQGTIAGAPEREFRSIDAQIGDIAQLQRERLPDAPGTEEGAEVDPKLKKWMSVGGREELHNEVQAILNSASAATGGEILPEVRQFAMGISGGATDDIGKAISMRVGTDAPGQEAAMGQNVLQQHQLLGMMMQANPPPPVVAARQAIVSSPSWGKYKQRHGLQTDAYGIRLLRKQKLADVRRKRGEDRQQVSALFDKGSAPDAAIQVRTEDALAASAAPRIITPKKRAAELLSSGADVLFEEETA